MPIVPIKAGKPPSDPELKLCACQIVAQLPTDRETALKTLEYARELVLWAAAAGIPLASIIDRAF